MPTRIVSTRTPPGSPLNRSTTSGASTWASGDPHCEPCATPLVAADLSGLPPALVHVAEIDPLADDGRRYAERLRAAGVDATLRVAERMIHGFPPGAAHRTRRRRRVRGRLRLHAGTARGLTLRRRGRGHCVEGAASTRGASVETHRGYPSPPSQADWRPPAKKSEKYCGYVLSVASRARMARSWKMKPIAFMRSWAARMEVTPAGS